MFAISWKTVTSFQYKCFTDGKWIIIARNAANDNRVVFRNVCIWRCCINASKPTVIVWSGKMGWFQDLLFYHSHTKKTCYMTIIVNFHLEILSIICEAFSILPGQYNVCSLVKSHSLTHLTQPPPNHLFLFLLFCVFFFSYFLPCANQLLRLIQAICPSYFDKVKVGIEESVLPSGKLVLSA